MILYTYSVVVNLLNPHNNIVTLGVLFLLNKTTKIQETNSKSLNHVPGTPQLINWDSHSQLNIPCASAGDYVIHAMPHAEKAALICFCHCIALPEYKHWKWTQCYKETSINLCWVLRVDCLKSKLWPRKNLGRETDVMTSEITLISGTLLGVFLSFDPASILTLYPIKSFQQISSWGHWASFWKRCALCHWLLHPLSQHSILIPKYVWTSPLRWENLLSHSLASPEHCVLLKIFVTEVVKIKISFF